MVVRGDDYSDMKQGLLIRDEDGMQDVLGS